MGDTKAQEEDGNLFLLSLPPPPSPSSSRSLSSSSLFCQSKVRSTFRVRRPLRPIPASSVALSPHLSLSPSPSYTPARFCFLAGLWCESRRNGGNVAETGGVSGERRKIPPSVSGTNESIATEHRRARGRESLASLSSVGLFLHALQHLAVKHKGALLSLSRAGTGGYFHFSIP